MSSRTWLNLVLLVVIALLGLVVYLEPGVKEEQRVALTDIDSQQVGQFTIERAGQPKLVFQRQGNQWELKYPVEADAHQFKVEQVLGWLTTSSLKRYSAKGLDLAQYGLSNPAVRLLLPELTIVFGQLDPLNHHRYVLLDNTIHMVSDQAFSTLTAEWSDFVSLAPLPEGKRISELVVPNLGKLAFKDNGWVYTGDKPPASADAYQTLIDAWANARAVDVKSLLKLPVGDKVTIRFFDDVPSLEFYIAKDDNSVVLMRPDIGVEYHFSESQLQRMLSWSPVTEES